MKGLCNNNPITNGRHQRLGSACLRRGEAGFTFFELAMAMMIIIIVSAIAVSNFIRITERARFAVCISNQRSIAESALLYLGSASPGDATINFAQLVAGGWSNVPKGECPSSHDDSFDDYTIEFINNRLEDVQCLIEPINHAWKP